MVWLCPKANFYNLGKEIGQASASLGGAVLVVKYILPSKERTDTHLF